MKRKNGILMVFGLAGVLVCALLLWRARSAGEHGDVGRMERIRGEFSARKVNGSDWIVPPPRRSAESSKSGAGEARTPDSADREDPVDARSERLVEAIHEALNKEDLSLAVEMAKEAAQSRSVEVRSEMVDVLRWFGDRAMPELLPFVDDPDEGVRVDAMTAYQQAIYDIEDEREKAKVVEITMRHLRDADALEEIATELLRIDERLSVRTLVNVISGGGREGDRIARETYRTVTGEDYTTPEAAEAWVFSHSQGE